MMKRILILLALLGATLLTACTDYNDQFEGLDEKVKLVVQQSYETEITSTDIANIVAALKAKKTHADSVMAGLLNSTLAFSEEVPAALTVPYALNKRYLGMDINSAANVTFPYRVAPAAHVAKASTAPVYTLTNEDYASARGDSVRFLTPEVTPENKIPDILQNRLGAANNGDLALVIYDYADREPSSSTELLNPDFNNFTSLTSQGWDTTRVSGTANVWSTINNQYGKYFQARIPYGVTTAGQVAYVSPAFTLYTNKLNRVSFSYQVGNFNYPDSYAPCLRVLMLQGGSPISSALDITDHFTLTPNLTKNGWSNVWASAGSYMIDGLTGIYRLVFLYDGDPNATPKRVSGYQINNIKVTQSEKVATVPIAPSERTDTYMYKAGAWQPCGGSIALDEMDYSGMGVTSLSSTTAPLYLPQFLAIKFPYAQEGNIMVVIYKRAGSSTYIGDEYIFRGGRWQYNTLIEKRTEQFVFSGWSNAGWIFDPTVRYSLAQADYKTLLTYVEQNHGGYYDSEYKDSEYYYGASTYRNAFSWTVNKWVALNPEYAALSTDAERMAYCEARTQAGVQKFLELKYPGATPSVNGVEQRAFITVATWKNQGIPIYFYYTYEFKCVGENPSQWEFVKREEKK